MFREVRKRTSVQEIFKILEQKRDKITAIAENFTLYARLDLML